VVNTQTRDTPLTIIIIIGIILATILAVRTIYATMNYYTEYFNYLACSYKALLTGNIKAYTTCSINALKTIWNALEATPKILTQELGWW
jgi:hypothetical protein